jgi:hypothetical protein
MILGVMACLCSGCALTSSTQATTPTATIAATATGAPTSVKVYFSKMGDAVPAHVFPVTRSAPAGHLETFAIEQLILGPTAVEAQTGLYSALTNRFIGTSNCGGPDFTLRFDQRDKTPEVGTTTMQLCREIPSPGDTGAVIILNEVSATLKQFPTIQKVIIINFDNTCFADLVGC